MIICLTINRSHRVVFARLNVLERHQQGGRDADELLLAEQLFQMLHGAQSRVFFILHSVNRGEIPLLFAVKYVVNGQ